MRKLLNKGLTRFMGYTAVIMLLSTPLFFFAMKHFYVEDLDELLQFRSSEFIAHHLPDFEALDIAVWNRYNEEVQILSDTVHWPMNRVVQHPFYNRVERASIDYRILYTPITIQGEKHVLMSRVSLIETHDLLGTLILFYVLMLLVLLIVLTILSRLVAERLWRPFNDTLHKLELFALEGEVVPEFTNTTVREFYQLNTVLTTLIERNLHSYKIQREFTQHASHELQTPLAIFQTKLDLLLQQSDLTEPQANIVQSLYKVSARISRLNKNLLLLAKMENRQFDELRLLPVDVILPEILAYFETQLEERNIKLTMELREPLLLKANKSLLDSLITNLIANAVQHNRPDGEVFIIIEKDKLVFWNTGTNCPLNKALLFHRFYKASQINVGNGLGLSIVYRICLYHGWKIDYVFNNGYHQFIVYF